MKITVTVLVTLSVASAFVVKPAATTFRSPFTQLASEPATNDEEGGLDLDLGEMFEMFDAADKEEKFDDAIKKVKDIKSK